jgi:hypothetical protein
MRRQRGVAFLRPDLVLANVIRSFLLFGAFPVAPGFSPLYHNSVTITVQGYIYILVVTRHLAHIIESQSSEFYFFVI